MRARRSAFLCALLLAAACRRAEEKETAPAVAVTTAKVAKGTVEETLELSGRLVPPPEEDASIAPQVAGRITALLVREGDRVKAGQLLARLDAAPLEEAERAAAAAVAKAREEAAVKEKAAALTAKLNERGIASGEERDNDRAAAGAARAALVDAESHLSQARRQRSWAEITAPFDGAIAQVLKHVGETVDGTPATAVVRLLGGKTQEVAAEAAANIVSRIRVGEPASVKTAAGGDPAPAIVVRVPAAVDPANGLAEVRARLASPSAAPLLSAATIAIVVSRKENVLVVPPAALRRSEEGTEEVVVDEGSVAKPRAVKTGLRSAAAVEVLSGVADGELVVVDDPLGLAEGTKLTVRQRK